MRGTNSIWLLSGGSFIWTMLLTSCGDNLTARVDAANDAPDPDAPAVCDCPATEPPLAGRIELVSFPQIIPANSDLGQGASCPVDSQLITGSCTTDLPSPTQDLDLRLGGYFSDEAAAWNCWVHNNEPSPITIRASLRCLKPELPSNAAGGEFLGPGSASTVCDCPAAEPPLADRFVVVTRTQAIPSNSTGGQEAACPPGAQIILGSCTHDFPTVVKIETLQQAGFYDNGAGSWSCRFRNSEPTPITIQTSVICLKPAPAPASASEPGPAPAAVNPAAPAVCACPEAEPPLAGRFVVVSQTQVIAGNARGGQDATCPAGALLISGSCTTDVLNPIRDVTLQQSGFFDSEPGSWTCRFRNNEATPVTTRTSVICLNPEP